MRTNNMRNIILEKKCLIILKIWLVKFQIFSFRVVYLAKFSMDFSNRVFKIKVYMFSTQNKIIEILTKDFCSIDDQTMKTLQVIQNHLWRHNFPRKLASKLLCIRGFSRESKRKQRLILLFKRVSFLKNTSSFTFSSLSYCGASNLGKSMLIFLGKLWRHRQF